MIYTTQRSHADLRFLRATTTTTRPTHIARTVRVLRGAAKFAYVYSIYALLLCTAVHGCDLPQRAATMCVCVCACVVYFMHVGTQI